MTGAEKEPRRVALLALAYPGLGHVYIREWTRALVWFFLIASIPIVYQVPIPDAFTVAAVREAALSVSWHVPVVWISVTLLSVRDAYVLASQQAADSASPQTRCPHCRKELDDPSLSFCQWCAEPLSETEE